MITEWQIAIRLVAAAVLGGLVGIERERHNQPAGLRTHVILSIGSALAMTVSIDMAMQFQPMVPMEAITKVPSQQSTDKLVSRLSHIQGIQGFEIQ